MHACVHAYLCFFAPQSVVYIEQVVYTKFIPHHKHMLIGYNMSYSGLQPVLLIKNMIRLQDGRSMHT